MISDIKTVKLGKLYFFKIDNKTFFVKRDCVFGEIINPSSSQLIRITYSFDFNYALDKDLKNNDAEIILKGKEFVLFPFLYKKEIAKINKIFYTVQKQYILNSRYPETNDVLNKYININNKEFVDSVELTQSKIGDDKFGFCFENNRYYVFFYNDVDNRLHICLRDKDDKFLTSYIYYLTECDEISEHIQKIIKIKKDNRAKVKEIANNDRNKIIELLTK